MVKEFVDVLSTPISLMLKLREIVKKHLKKKKTEARFLGAFENETKIYMDTYNQLLDLSEKQLLPVFESVKGEFTPHDMNVLLEKMAPIPLIYADLIKAFISFARACSEVSVIKGFMEDLKETNIVLYDFVDTMKNTYNQEKNRVTINGGYYRFFKTYEKDIFEEIEEVGETEIEELKPFIEKLKKLAYKTLHYATKTALIKRRIREKYRRNYRILVRSTTGMTVEKTTIINLRTYIPRKLLPLAIVIEELSL